MKNVYSKMLAAFVCLFTVACGLNAQNLFVDLNYPDDFTISYNNKGNSLSIRNKAVMPVALPEIPVETDNVFVLESPDIEGYLDWYNAIVAFAEMPEITEEDNFLRTLIYPSSTEVQVIVKDDKMQPIYHFRQPLTPNQWNTVDIDFSSPFFLGTKISCIEFAPVVVNTVTYIFPYWESSSKCISSEHFEVFENLPDSVGKYFFRTNAPSEDIYTTEPVPLTSELKEGLPSDVNPSHIFKLTSTDSPIWEWWWVNIWQLKEGSYAYITEEHPVLKIFVKTDQDKIVLGLRDGVGEQAWYQPNLTYDVIPNQWNEIHIDFTGRIGYHFASIEMSTYYKNTTAYICPMFCKETKQPSTSIEASNAIDNVPYISNGKIKVEEDADLKLYNVIGQCVESNYGKTVKAIKGLNIVQVNGVSYKLMNK